MVFLSFFSIFPFPALVFFGSDYLVYLIWRCKTSAIWRRSGIALPPNRRQTLLPLDKSLAGRRPENGPGPKNQALISPQLPAHRACSSERGVVLVVWKPMEWWSWWSNGRLNTTDQKRVMVYFYLSSCTIHVITDLNPPNPILQHSNIPLPLGIHLWHSQAPLGWPMGPGVQYWRK